MKTKARRDAQLRALVRVQAQARLTAGDLASRGRAAEAQAYLDVAEALAQLALLTRVLGAIPVQGRLF